jgi:hypothetical protein
MRSAMRASLLISLLLLLAAPVYAGEAEKPLPQEVALAPLALPVISQGRLRNYVFVSLRLKLAEGVDAHAMQEKEPYFRDALVRAGHRTPFTIANDWTRLDEGALKRTMIAEAARVVGPGVIVGVEVARSTPQRRIITPHN